MKVALAHDFLIRWGGAEKVLFDLHKLFPEAPIYTLFYDKKFTNEYFSGMEIRSSYLQKRCHLLKRIKEIMGRQGINGIHRLLLPFMPIAVESMDFSNYDLVISSSSGFVKGVIVSSKTKHICYMHTPTRWAWQDRPLAVSLKNAKLNAEKRQIISVDQRGYQRRSASRKILMAISGISLMNFVKRLYIHLYRLWDFEASQRPDVLIANSQYTAQRIKKYYGREARAVYPGVEITNSKSQIINKFEYQNSKSKTNSKFQILNSKPISDTICHIPHTKYFIVVSRLSVYKKIDLIVEAFKNLAYNLVIVGEGPETKSLKFKVESLKLKNRIFFTGFIQEKKEILALIKNSIALIHSCEEDFGLVMVEAMKLGKPVIAYDRGGAKEIVISGVNGELFGKDADSHRHESRFAQIRSLEETVKKVAENQEQYKPEIIKKSVEKFSEKEFEREMVLLIANR